MRPTRPPHRRPAMLVLSVLGCLALLMLLMVSWLRIVSLERGQLRAQQDRVQAEYLADSALRRAAARLAADPAYDGETIQASAESLAAGAPASVAVRVETAADDPQARLVTASARVPADSPRAAVRSKQQNIHLPTREQAP